jgi:hypothetical protein
MKRMVIALPLLVLAGCASPPDKPYLFAQTRVAGISAAAGPGAGGADFTLGYRRRDVVLVPSGAAEGGAPKETPSVLAQFEPKPEPQGGMGKFFAMGKAAERLAEGLAKDRPHAPVNVARGEGAKPKPAKATR